ncbi:MAG: mevalonate kinase [Capnocytophaga sp.]|nr:mevalonate kinase [Capnocytophaga sp.]
MVSPLFYSKILLFGEYGIIKDSKGLAIPYNCYNGTLKKTPLSTQNEEQQKSNQSLEKYAHYLAEISEQNPEIVQFNISLLQKDIQEGMYFDSSIPQGYGVGSSGALVAAIYDKYAIEKISATETLTQKQLLKLKEIFGQMESFFHGKSSGLDPLNSYLSLPILINSQNHIEATGIPLSVENGKGAVFLLDSGMIGETAPMVQIFMEKMKNEGFRNMLKHKFSKYTDACIDNFLQGNFKSLVQNVKELSGIVLNHFKPMIPQQFHELWQKGIDSGDYYLKLCGSGGGGYILGFTPDYEKAQKALKGHKLELVYQF